VTEPGPPETGAAAVAIQDRMRDNWCWGCGSDNPEGLHLKTYWDGEIAVATFSPDAKFAAGPRHVLNGGLIATLLDCHGVCTAIARTYDEEGRAIGSDPDIWRATTTMTVQYLRPTPIDAELELHGHVTDVGDKVLVVECTLSAAGKERARATVASARVPEEWRHGMR
jgi:acyl-coenzyme A thioesterase PaaI-like protein